MQNPLMQADKALLTLRRDGYDPFIDFMKGVCIILVVLTHCLPENVQDFILFPLWGRPAVPLFLIIQVFHAYKKGLDTARTNYRKLWQRIVKPFLITELVIVVLLWAMATALGGCNWSYFTQLMVTNAGFGPGAYFTWIYVQFAILLPLLVPLFKRIKGGWLAVAFILVCELIEVLCSVTAMPVWLYRLLFLRYVFLIYLGYELTFKGYLLSWCTISLSVLSIAATLFLVYSDISLSPFIYDTYSWRPCHWICYFYIAYLMMWMLKWVDEKTGAFAAWNGYMKKLGRYSYEIFLFQMLYFAVFHEVLVGWLLLFIPSNLVVQVVAVIMALVICIVPVVAYKDRKKVKSPV